MSETDNGSSLAPEGAGPARMNGAGPVEAEDGGPARVEGASPGSVEGAGPARDVDAGPRPPGDLNPRTDPALDFPDRDFEAMKPGDYDAIGFMSGLEVHQQLDTRSKLFCRCPSGRYVTTYDAEVLRHMRPTLSELGEYDGTALMEFKTKKEIVYELERGSVCTYEMDDTPPFEISEEAVRIAIEVSQLLNLNLVSELHVMRKQYLDGSIPTGFQRTAMVGLTGTIPFQVPELGVSRELSIRQLSLEEDSCREMADEGHRITFRTDRLGMPLIETVTEPELVTPLELQAAGRLLAQVARATGKVRRGPGAARQDVNVSVAGGRRIEIKGVDNHKGLPRLVHIEAFRQLNLLRIREELHTRGVTADLLSYPEKGYPWERSMKVVDAGNTLAFSDFAPLRQALDRGETVAAVRLPGFGGLLAHRTQPGVTFAGEIADRIRVIACPAHQPFLVHSDLAGFGLESHHWRALGNQLRAESGDAMVVVWAAEQDCATAVREIFIRAQDALVGVPAETRQAFPDGTNGFERILPGPDRMYPDTDTPPLPIAETLVESTQAALPETPWSREDRYRTLGLGAQEAQRLARSAWGGLFDQLSPRGGPTALGLARVLEKRIPHHVRKGRIGGEELNGGGATAAAATLHERLEPLVRGLEEGQIRLEAAAQILDHLVTDRSSNPDEILHRYRMKDSDLDDLDILVESVVEAARTELRAKSLDVVLSWGTGRLMRRFLGRLDPVLVRTRLEEALAAAGWKTLGREEEA